jgi:hypothetical protein
MRSIEQMPDFQIRHNPSRHLIWVECKFRSSLHDGKIQWSEPEQLGRYKDFQRKVRPEKVYVVMVMEAGPPCRSRFTESPLMKSSTLDYPQKLSKDMLGRESGHSRIMKVAFTNPCFNKS